MKKTITLLALILAVLLLGACSGAGGNDGAGTAAKNYFEAIASGDADRIATLSCPDWESSARDEVAAFAGVKARLEDVTCQPVEGSDPEPGDSVESPESLVVECSGAIVATYNNEDQSFDLQGRKLSMSRQGSEWLVCGYAQ
jgi:hypothetical protein